MSIEESSIDIYFTSPLDIKGKIKPPIDEEGVIEYDIDHSQSSSRTCSMTEEYVLPNSNQESNQHEMKSELQHSRPIKPVIQDEYDEDLYCLARSVEDGTASVRSDVNEKPKYYDHTLEVNFTQRFFFKRSDYDKRLKATANGVTSDVFQGCRYQAMKGRFLSVDITSGN